MIPLRQSTAKDIKMGPALDKTDGVTAETGLTPTVELSKSDGAFAPRNAAGAITHDADGWYLVPLNTTDTATLGRLVAKFDDPATHLVVWHEFWVFPAVVFDSLFAGSDKLQIDVAEWLGTAPATPGTAGVPKVAIEAAGDLAQGAADKVWSTASRALTDKVGFALSEDARLAIWDTLTSALDLAGSIGKFLVDRLDAAISSRSSHAPGDVRTELATELAHLDADVSSRSDHSAADVRTEMDANSTKLDVAVSTRASGDDILAVGTIAQANQTYLTDSLSDVVQDSVWGATLANYANAGTAGLKLNSLTGAAGSGAIEHTHTVNIGGPIEGADVWVTATNNSAAAVLASGKTNSLGEVTFFLDAGHYYVWTQKIGYRPTNPTEIDVA